ncbi:unnamed protein product [Orchesella dallaii]|uniref:Uncharacterized protein n=1 Tax=Orchesella dallaii TaxID=48710 RepID=A0ABP1RM02_9HEXA
MAPQEPLQEDPHVPAEDVKIDKYKSLMTRAPFIPSESNPLIPIADIPWLDESLIKSGCLFYITHLSQSLFAFVLNFVIGLPVKSVTCVLLKNQMGDPKEHFPKVLATLKMSFNFCRFYLDKNRAYKLYELGRKRHILARKFHPRPSTKLIQHKEDFNLFIEKLKQEVANAEAVQIYIPSILLPHQNIFSRGNRP